MRRKGRDSECRKGKNFCPHKIGYIITRFQSKDRQRQTAPEPVMSARSSWVGNFLLAGTFNILRVGMERGERREERGDEGQMF